MFICHISFILLGIPSTKTSLSILKFGAIQLGFPLATIIQVRGDYKLFGQYLPKYSALLLKNRGPFICIYVIEQN